MTRLSINLLGVERKEAQAKSTFPVDKGWFIAGIIVVACLVVTGGSVVLLDGMVSQANATIEAQNEEVKELETKLKEVQNLEKQKESLLMEEKILLYVTGETYKWSYFMQEIRMLMPLDVSINDLKINVAGEFILTGTAPNYRTTAYFLRNLENSKMIADALLMKTSKDKNLTTFEIKCNVKMAAGS